MLTKKTLTAGLALAFASSIVLTGCSMGASGTSDDTTAPATEETSEAMDDGAMDDMDPAAALVGPGCADYAEAVPDGAGSVAGMAEDPVATAASNNPLLTTLTAAVSGGLNPDVDLVDTLNGDEFTVFAPVDDAFAQIDADTIETLSTDSELLTSILTYHVVAGQIGPDEIVGSQVTLNGAEVEVTGSGDDLMVDGAGVICGGVQTANATVYLIDTVLLPPAS